MQTVRHYALSFPFLVFATVACIVYIAGLRLGKRLEFSGRFWRRVAILAIGLEVLFALVYFLDPGVADAAETSVASVAALLLNGAPLYPPLNGAAQYALLYGPVTYLAPALFYLAFGVSIVSAKAVGLVSCLLAIALSYRLVRRYVPGQEAVTIIGAEAFALLYFGYKSFWLRGDPQLLLYVALGLTAAQLRRRWVAVLLAGASAACIVGVKLTGVTYLLPVLALMALRHRRIAAFAAGCAGAILGLAPFLSPNISLAGYVDILRVASQHGIDSWLISRNVQLTAMFWAPIALTYLSTLQSGPDARARLTASGVSALGAAMLAGMAGACWLGGKPGAGEHHLMPFLPCLAVLYSWIRSLRNPVPAPVGLSGPALRRVSFSVATAWVATLGGAMITAPNGYAREIPEFVRHWPRAAEARAEIRRTVEAHPKEPIGMAYGGDDATWLSALRFDLVYLGEPYILDERAIQDFAAGGIEIPRTTVQYVEGCRTKIWLIPAGSEPFSLHNHYTGRPLFSEEFRRAFFSHYRMTSRGRSFDLWTCAKRQASASGAIGAPEEGR